MAILPVLLVALVVTTIMLCVRLVRQSRPRIVQRIAQSDAVIVRFTGGPTLTLDAALASLDEPPARPAPPAAPQRRSARGTPTPRRLPGMPGTAELEALRDRPSRCRIRVPPKPMDFSDTKDR